MQKKISIIYTSDTHGRLSAYDFMNGKFGAFGLSRLSSYLKNLNTPYLLLDNGDFLQGSPLLDYSRKNSLYNPAAKIFNSMNYEYVTLGNHDFNYGLPYLSSFQSQYHGDILCANIHKNGKPFYKTHAIRVINEIRVAIIGVTTEFIPFWEKPENLDGFKFLDAVETTKKVIADYHLKQNSDLIIVLYHGGFNQNLETNQVYGSKTVENKGYELFQIQDIDILLTGHQHIPQGFQKNGRVALQTSHNAKDFGLIDILFDDQMNKKIHAHIIPLSSCSIDSSIEALLENDIQKTNKYLSQKIGTIINEMCIYSPLDCRVKKHALFQFINQVQLEYTKADISVASLPNETNGFPHDLTLSDIAVNFPFENDLVVLEVTGEILKEALEKNASYFSKVNQQIVVNPKFLFPKVEHYNYDVYDGISYIMDINQEIGQRIVSLTYQNEDIKPNSLFKLAINSYRAIGSGGFEMFKKARKIISYPVSYFDLIKEYIEKHPVLEIETIENFKVI